MRKNMLALVTAALALMGCGNIAGPDDATAAANAAKAKQALDAASQPVAAPSHRLAAN